MSGKVFSERSLEGYLEIDHTNSPGFTAEEAARAGTLFVGLGQKVQLPTRNCSHCEQLVLLNPLRTRERARCPKCFGYLCDPCGVTYKVTAVCYCMKQRIDDLMDAQAKGK